MLRLNDILDKVTAYHPEANLDVLRKAYIYSAKVHGGQVRKSGEPYLTHPLAVAFILAELELDEASVATGLLHDTVEDTLATTEEIESLFGRDIAALVDGVTKLAQIHFQNQDEKLAENFRKMLIAMSQDIRVLLVKLADRLHNMRTLQHMSAYKQKRIARETMDIYAPLANRLGISWIKVELEDLSFRYIKPLDFGDLEEKLGKTQNEREKFIEDVTAEIRSVLARAGLPEFDVSGRPKHLWSVFKKMISKSIPFEEVHDLIAFRIIVDNVGQCYETLGHIHSMWRPIPGRFKDYIAMPKPNGYKSLHTTVIGPKAERIEIQIRTEDMHQVAEAGIAAHWSYKESGSVASLVKGNESFAWLRQLMNWQRELVDPNEFLDSVKVDLFADEVYVFTPGGDVMELPRGATPVDFAFSIHTQVGETCIGAKVNGRLIPLKTQLRNGDTVEILTRKGQKPNKDWLEFVKTTRARTKIRSYLRMLERERSLQIGTELLEKEFKRYGTSLSKYLKSKAIEKAYEGTKHGNAEDVIVHVGYGKLGAQAVAQKVLPEELFHKAQESPPTKSRLGQLIDRVARRSSSGVIIDGIEDMLVHYARCCYPVKGDAIIGFVTRGRGLTIHRRDCQKIHQLDPERRIRVSWDSKVDLSRPMSIRVVSDDREGMLSELSNAFTKNKMNISQAVCKSRGDGTAINTFKCGVISLDQLQKVVKALEGVKGVRSVERAKNVDVQ